MRNKNHIVQHSINHLTEKGTTVPSHSLFPFTPFIKYNSLFLSKHSLKAEWQWKRVWVDRKERLSSCDCWKLQHVQTEDVPDPSVRTLHIEWWNKLSPLLVIALPFARWLLGTTNCVPAMNILLSDDSFKWHYGCNLQWRVGVSERHRVTVVNKCVLCMCVCVCEGKKRKGQGLMEYV